MAGIAEALMQPFVWSGGEAVTKAELDRRKKISDALRAPESYHPTGPWSTIGALAGEGVAAMQDSQTSAAESSAQKAVADALAKGDYQSVLSNSMATPQQSAVASALWQQKQQESDPLRQLQIEQAQLNLEQDKNPPPADRKYEKDPNGVPRYLDTGEPVFPDAVTGAPPPDVKGESQLRTEYQGINTVKDFGLQTQAYQRVLDSAKEPTAAGDLALIFNYMKVLDPGSTVREGEFATAAATGSFGEQIQAAAQKIMSGQRLTPEQRMDFVKRAGQLFQGAAGLQEGTNARYTDVAQQYGYDPARIVAQVPKIGVLDPQFNLADFVGADGKQTKPLPVTSDADYDALPSGAVFQAPDGSIRRKP